MKHEQRKLYKLTKAQMQIIIGMCFSAEPKKAAQGNLVVFSLYAAHDFNSFAMEQAFNCLLQRNDALRLRILPRWNGLRQYIQPYQPRTLQCVRVDGRAGFEQLSDNWNESIPLFSDHLCRAVLADCGDGSGGIQVICHHLCCDGYSIGLMHRQLDSYYRTYQSGGVPGEEKQYSIERFFSYEEQYLQSPQYKADRKWWSHAYNHQPRFCFPAGRIPWKCSLEMETLVLAGDDFEKLHRLCQKLSCPFTAVITTLGALTVYCMSGDQNFALYTLTHGRMTLPLRQTVGCMFNSVPLFYDIPEKASIEEYLSQSYIDYLEALSHARFPTGDQVLMAAKETYIKRFGYNYFWFVYSTMDYMDVGTDLELELISAPDTYLMGLFYCGLLNNSAEKQLCIQLTYQKRRYSRESVRSMLKAFHVIFKIACEDGACSLEQLRGRVLEALQ